MTTPLGVDPEAVLAHLPLTTKQNYLLNWIKGAPRGSAEREFSAQLRAWAVTAGLAELNENGHIVPTSVGLVAVKVSNDHQFTFGNKVLGRHPVANMGNRYGTTARCRCGWRGETNESPRGSRGDQNGRDILAAEHAQHVRDYFLGTEAS